MTLNASWMGGPAVRLTALSSEPLREALDFLSHFAQRVEPQGPILAWGRRALELPPEAIRPWFARAWWGSVASRLVLERLCRGRVEEVLELLLPVDTGPLDRALEKGRGALLGCSHLGPSGVDRMLLSRMKYDLLCLVAGRFPLQLDLKSIDVSREEERKKSLTACLLHLRRNGVVMAAADGRFGSAMRPYLLLNHSVGLQTGLANLCRMASAPTLWYSALWEPQGGGIRFQFEESGLDPEPNPETWEEAWLSAYAKWIGNIMTTRPESLRFQGGLWGPREGGFLSPPATQACPPTPSHGGT